MKKNLFIKPLVCIPIYKSEFNNEITSIKSHIIKLKAHDIFVSSKIKKKNNIKFKKK